MPTTLMQCRKNDDSGKCLQHSCSRKDEDDDSLETEISNGSDDPSGNYDVRSPMFQKGVLRTNCIDCLDRTNVAQYAYGLVGLGHQLHALGITESPDIDLDNPLAEDLMRVYEAMGDTLALQYGGSAAHNKVTLLNISCRRVLKLHDFRSQLPDI